MAKVTKDMLIGQLITLDPNIAPILMRAGMHCLGSVSYTHLAKSALHLKTHMLK